MLIEIIFNMKTLMITLDLSKFMLHVKPKITTFTIDRIDVQSSYKFMRFFTTSVVQYHSINGLKFSPGLCMK